MSTGDEKPQEDNAEPDGAATDENNSAEAENAAAEGSSDDVATLREAASQAKDQVLRVQAEMQNLRRRVDRDIENAHKFALDKFVAELLPVVDNLERALATIDASDDTQRAIGEGIELTLKSFQDVLVRNKVEQVDPVGQGFDPEFHQAMAIVPHPELAANTVIEVFQKGYLLNGRLVRPAMVVVSRGVENDGVQG